MFSISKVFEVSVFVLVVRVFFSDSLFCCFVVLLFAYLDRGGATRTSRPAFHGRVRLSARAVFHGSTRLLRRNPEKVTGAEAANAPRRLFPTVTVTSIKRNGSTQPDQLWQDGEYNPIIHYYERFSSVLERKACAFCLLTSCRTIFFALTPRRI